MSKKLALILGVVLTVSCFQANASDYVEFRKSSKGRGNSGQNQGNYSDSNDSQTEQTQGSGEDQDILNAVASRRGANYVEGRGMVVTKLLPDDTNGLEHQKWIVRLSNGTLMQAVYNLDMCERVQIQVGDVVSMGGQFIWTGGGAMLHWLHFDPREKRPDGYVEVNGKVYCGDGARHK